jgi:penicillin-binding protein 2
MFQTLKEILSSIKEIILEHVKHRLFPVTIIMIALFCVLVRQLFILQIEEGEEHMDNFIYKSERTLSVESVRGNIYDRNGKLLAYNDLSYSVRYSNNTNISNVAEQKGMDENELKNKILYDTINILEENGDELFVDFPVDLDGDGYKFTVTEGQLRTFFKNVYSVTDYDELDNAKKEATADDIMEYLCSDDRFGLDGDYTNEEKLKIIACRYKLWLNRYQQYMPVTIAYDISEESNAVLTEYADELLGIEVVVKSLRRYNDAEYFAHIIGYVGAISDDELTTYNENLSDEDKYSSDEIVGKTGIEQYAESQLRGKQGYKTMYVDNLGKVIETIDEESASAGNDVYLTIDADLQKYCYDTLEKEIASILLANIEAVSDVEDGENVKIPITDVYFGLFNNNVISLSDMQDSDASDLEKSIYSSFSSRKTEVVNRIDDLLTKTYTPLYDLSEEYQEYMEYICEFLSDNDIFDTSLISSDDPEFTAYTNNETSLEHYLKYAISLEAIDISAFDAENSYYDTDESYSLLCDYILDNITGDPEFDKRILEYMIKSGEITGSNVIELLYTQGVLNAANDPEYEDFKNGVYGAYEFMLRKIKNLEITPAMLALDPCSGSIIVTDVNTGDVLAMVSYPSYDNNYLTNEVDAAYYNKLLEDKTMPLYNRATQQKTAPGSTYKILSSVAGLTEGVIAPGTVHYCSGEFDKLDPAPKCWLSKGGHGGLDVESAIQYSCNVYFYNVGYDLSFTKDGTYSDSYGLERLAKYASLFGLDEVSGVEIPETSPTVSDSDAVRSAIGQGKNSYTPSQLARYVTTIANSGTCYNLTLIDKITDYEGNLVEDNSAEVKDTLDEVSQTTWNTVHNGMRRVVSVYTSKAALVNKVNVAVAGKTGTAQESENRPDHALFISYAPYDDPEVSVTCVIQNGYSSGNATELAGFVYAYMYDKELLNDAEMSGNETVSD